MKQTIIAVSVLGRRWFEKVNGNTYHSVVVEIAFADGSQQVLIEPFAYGYGTQYRQTAEHLLERADLPTLADLRMQGVPVFDNVVQVQRKKDLT